MPRFVIHLCRLLFLFLLPLSSQGQTAADLFAEKQIPEFRLTIRQDNWKDVLDSLQRQGSNMLIGAVEINGTKYPNVGIRYKGTPASGPKGDRFSFKLHLDFIHPGQDHEGLPVMVLSNSLRDPSYLREYTGFRIAARYMVAPRANFAKVFVNDEYFGMYILVEPVDRTFLNNHLGEDNWNTLFKCSTKRLKDNSPPQCTRGAYANLSHQPDLNCYLYNYDLKEGDSWVDLVELTRILEREPGRLAEILDIDAVLWMLAFNNVTAHLSSYTGRMSHNYYLFKRADGRFVPVVGDLHLAFGSFKNTGVGSDLSSKAMENLDPFLNKDNPAKPLIKVLLSDELYRKIYVAHVKQINEDFFKEDKFTTWTKELHKQITPLIAKQPNTEYSMEDFEKSLSATIGEQSKIPGLASFMAARSTYISKNRDLRVIAPEFVRSTLNSREAFSPDYIDRFAFTLVADRDPLRAYLYYRFDGSDTFSRIAMTLDAKAEGLTKNQKQFLTSIRPPEGKSEIEYYFLIENKGAVSFHPNAYTQERLSARLEDLNK